VAREIAVRAGDKKDIESRTASLYTALLDKGGYSSGPRYKPRTMSSFVERRRSGRMIGPLGGVGAGLLARFSPCSV
jgi:hypothetical protein